jgi:hypothetical protein
VAAVAAGVLVEMVLMVEQVLCLVVLDLLEFTAVALVYLASQVMAAAALLLALAQHLLVV